MTTCMDRRAHNRKVPKWLPFKNISKNNQKSNQHIEGIKVNIHTKYEVSMTMWAGEQVNEKYQKICHLKTISQND